MEKLQNVMLFGFGRLQQEPFIDDQQNWIGIFPLDFLICAVIMCHLQIKEQIRESDISCLVVLLTCFYSERTGQVGLSAPGCTGDKKIPVFCDIFTDCKPFNQGTVQLAPGSIVNVANVCIRLVEPGIADQALQTVSLTVTVFDVHQHPETVLKGGLRLGILHLDEECI